MKSYPHIDIVGNKRWFNEDKLLHRDEDDLPAVEWIDGTKSWWINGKRYRKNGLPAVEYVNGSKYWYDEVGLTVCRYDSYSNRFRSKII